ncbi:MAG: hydantoinase/oxoprolinase family protein [Archaeoglobaceae archaeon]
MIGVNVGGANIIAAVVSDEIKVFRKPAEMGISSVVNEIANFIERERVVVSTSLPLNVLISKFESMKTLTLLIPGPGLNYSRYGVILKGYVNHRGDVVEKIDEAEVKRVLENSAFQNVAIASKFSVRNPVLEEEVKKIVKEKVDEKRIALSYFVGGLNYAARINTTVINAKIKETVWNLNKELKNCIKEFYYLRGDGSISTPESVVENPAQLYNSNALASVFGAIFLTKEKDGVVVNIGGLSTNLIPIEDGKPKIVDGIEVMGRKTLIRCVDSIAIPFGGNSLIENDRLEPESCKPIAFGGEHFTLTDAINCLGHEIGNWKTSREIGAKIDFDVAVEQFISVVADNLRQIEAKKIIGAGFLAPYLVPEIAKRAKTSFIIPKYCEAIRAIGSAVARVSLVMHARFDTEKGIAIYNGAFEKCPFRIGSIPTEDEIIDTARKKIVEIAKKFGADEEIGEVKVLDFSSFTVVKGNMKRGMIADITLQIEPGIRWKQTNF